MAKKKLTKRKRKMKRKIRKRKRKKKMRQRMQLNEDRRNLKSKSRYYSILKKQTLNIVYNIVPKYCIHLFNIIKINPPVISHLTLLKTSMKFLLLI